jgi:nicotinamidase-related amidase
MAPMVKSSSLDSGGTALLLLDFHRVIVQSHERGPQAAHAASQALTQARARGFAVLFAVPHNRAGYPELPSGPPFDDVKANGLFCESGIADGMYATLAPRSDEAVVAKCRYSPFFANDLLHLLRMRGARTLVLCGIATSGVVLSAVRDAWDLDYRCIVLADACADNDAEVHRVLTEKILPKQANVTTVGDWIGQR